MTERKLVGVAVRPNWTIRSLPTVDDVSSTTGLVARPAAGFSFFVFSAGGFLPDAGNFEITADLDVLSPEHRAQRLEVRELHIPGDPQPVEIEQRGRAFDLAQLSYGIEKCLGGRLELGVVSSPGTIQTFCQQMAQIEAGLQPPILQVGNLDARRDFTHVTDVARALWLLLDRGAPGTVYNLCTGHATRIGDIVELVRARGRVPVEVRVDPARLRPSDEPILMGDNTRLRQATGWAAQIGMEQIVDELLEYWRDELRVKG